MKVYAVSDDMSNEAAAESLGPDAHAVAANEFVSRVLAEYGDGIVELYVFGSTIRGTAHGRSSDVDVLIVLADYVDRDATAEALRDIALDVLIEHGPAIELHILPKETFERLQREGNPFIRNVISEGQACV
jgi:predicted nucleotidyltransferase